MGGSGLVGRGLLGNTLQENDYVDSAKLSVWSSASSPCQQIQS